MKPVYNGYDEKIVTGADLKSLFPNELIATGRHHADVLGLTVEAFLSSRRSIKDDKTYRIFLNDNFCKVMPENSDKQLAFFAHVPIEQVKLYSTRNLDEVKSNAICPDCGK